jgi:predicted HTH transcriptional regulator
MPVDRHLSPSIVPKRNHLAVDVTVRLFFLRALQQQKRRLAAKVEREKSAITLTDLAVKILDYARDHGRVTTRDMVREHGASANTLKATFSSLVEKRLLMRHGGGRSTWYALQ